MPDDHAEAIVFDGGHDQQRLVLRFLLVFFRVFFTVCPQCVTSDNWRCVLRTCHLSEHDIVDTEAHWTLAADLCVAVLAFPHPQLQALVELRPLRHKLWRNKNILKKADADPDAILARALAHCAHNHL